MLCSDLHAPASPQEGPPAISPITASDSILCVDDDDDDDRDWENRKDQVNEASQSCVLVESCPMMRDGDKGGKEDADKEMAQTAPCGMDIA